VGADFVGEGLSYSSFSFFLAIFVGDVDEGFSVFLLVVCVGREVMGTGADGDNRTT
jgi:hypothetical protein